MKFEAADRRYLVDLISPDVFLLGHLEEALRRMRPGRRIPDPSSMAAQLRRDGLITHIGRRQLATYRKVQALDADAWGL